MYAAERNVIYKMSEKKCMNREVDMTEKETYDFIALAGRQGISMGTERMKALLAELSNPQDKLKVIHIAGTNGKGSVGAFLEGVLVTAGYSVGRYISPTLFSYRERIQRSYAEPVQKKAGSGGLEHVVPEPTVLNSQTIEKYLESAEKIPVQTEWISQGELNCVMSEIREACVRLELQGISMPTAFEIETAAAFLQCVDWNVDFMILETGMGGRDDATNVVEKPLATVFTSISKDHTAVLGDTLEEIARNKAGIMRSGVPVISARQETQVDAVLREQAASVGVEYVSLQTDSIWRNGCVCMNRIHPQNFYLQVFGNWEHFSIKQHGNYQRDNAALALRVLEALVDRGCCNVTVEHMRRGIYPVRWRGRFDILQVHPAIVADGAHNPQGVQKLVESVQMEFPDVAERAGRVVRLVFGVFQDKAYEEMLGILREISDTLYVVELPSSRGLSVENLKTAAEQAGFSVRGCGSAQELLEQAVKDSAPRDVIVACGSLSFLGEIYKSIEES